MKRWAMVAGLILLAAGCATGYHAGGLTGGFSEMRVSQRGWQVNFEGNGYTSPQRAQAFALRRAAELTLMSGYAGFYLAGEGNDVRRSEWAQPVNCYGTGKNVSCYGGGTQFAERPTTRLTINMVTAEEAAAVPAGYMVYDARMILGQAAR